MSSEPNCCLIAAVNGGRPFASTSANGPRPRLQAFSIHTSQQMNPSSPLTEGLTDDLIHSLTNSLHSCDWLADWLTH
jgi:TolB-like protein